MYCGTCCLPKSLKSSIDRGLLDPMLARRVDRRCHWSSDWWFLDRVWSWRLGSSTRMTTGLGGVTCLLGDACRRGVVALPLRGCSFRLDRRLVAVTIMSP